MKNYFYLIFSLFVFLSFSCQKEENLVVDDVDVGQSVIIPSKFKKEMTITDKTGENSVIMAVYADEEKYLDDFTNGNNFKLLVNEIDFEKIENSVKSTIVNKSNYDAENFDLAAQPKINIEFLSVNLQASVKTYSLDIQNVKTKSFIAGYPISQSSTRSFLGVVHLGWGYEFLTKLYFRKHIYNSWTAITDGAINAWMLDGVQNHINVNPGFDVYKRLIVLYPHKYENGVNYRFFEESWRYNSYLNGGGGSGGGGGVGPTPPGTEDEV